MRNWSFRLITFSTYEAVGANSWGVLVNIVSWQDFVVLLDITTSLEFRYNVAQEFDVLFW